MRIGAEARLPNLVAVALQLVFPKSTFEESSRINSGGRMRLEEHEIAAVLAIGRVKEMVEADLEDLSRGGVARDVAAEFAVLHIGADDHGQRVPADDGGDPRLHFDVAGKWGLFFERDAVAIGQEGRRVGN